VTSVAGSTVRKSNKTNRDAIGAAGDFRTWQRDALLRLAEEASQAAIEAHDLYFKVAHAPELEQGFNGADCSERTNNWCEGGGSQNDGRT
jgi:hypothetical protein